MDRLKAAMLDALVEGDQTEIVRTAMNHIRALNKQISGQQKSISELKRELAKSTVEIGDLF